VVADEGLQRGAVADDLVLVIATPRGTPLLLTLGVVGAAGLRLQFLFRPLPFRIAALVVAAANHGVEVLFDLLGSSNYVHQLKLLSHRPQ
jgi:hypothetical protein